MKTLKIVKIDDPEALDYIGRCEIYQAISDYEIWRRILLKDPEDWEAYQMMEDCEEFILTDPRVERCIKDPVDFLDMIDAKVEKDIKKWRKKCKQQINGRNRSM